METPIEIITKLTFFSLHLATPKHCLFGAKFNDFSAFLALNVGSSRCLRHDSLSKKVSPSVALLTFTNLCMTNIVQYVWCISV